jgi:uncharacterized protein (DUF1501 family)
MTRRGFIKRSSLAMFGVGAAPVWMARAASGVTSRNKVLVVVFQRGAADGLNVVVPYGEQAYYNARPEIAIPKSTAIDLNGFFGLHPSLASLKPLFDRKELAIAEATGSPDSTRSHFDAQDYMESGTPGLKSTNTGWLNRAMLPEHNPSAVRAISIGQSLPHALRGPQPAVAVRELKDFVIKDASASLALEAMYGPPDVRLENAGRTTFEAMSIIDKIVAAPYRPDAGARYPKSRFGGSLQQIARLIKAGVGLEVAFADIGGWDHHVNEVGASATQGPLANLLSDFARSIAAFHADLGVRMEDVVLVTMSEFGRTVRENGNRGTDHGHANLMFVLGGGVNGGLVHGKWPGLKPDQLYEGRDLAVTTDFRSVLSELVRTHLGNTNIASVFPTFTAAAPDFSVLRA